VASIVLTLGATLIWIFVRGPAAGLLGALAVVLLLAGQLAYSGLVTVRAGEARVIQLFGRYHSTVRAPGLHWVNPFTRKRRVSVRIRNLETAQAKVNDADGNPVEIAAVVVWQVRDTAQALYAVEDYPAFVATQADLEGERKAAMVSNLLVVLCSERPTKPVISIGSLYH
jgi:regulator of protease activity HflC (stomatin/prohibitin superfamily)